MDQFDKGQFEHFHEVERDRYFWQTGNPVIVRKEKELLDDLNSDNDNLILEVGCGEGANICNSFKGNKIVGIDYSLNRVRFASGQLKPKCRHANFICSDAYYLPFLNQSFDSVFCKDVLHHLAHKKAVIAEMLRVCKNGGSISFIEMNGSTNLIGRLFAALIKDERGMITLKAKEIESFLKDCGAVNIQVKMKQPLLLYRVVFHYKLIFAELSKVRPLVTMVELLDVFLGKIIPKYFWGYLNIYAEKK